MKTNTPTPKFTIQPGWILIVCFFCLSVWSLISALQGHMPKYSPRIPPEVCAIVYLCAALFFWKRTDFDEEGFTYSRFGIYRRRISWDQVFQITVTPYDRKGFVRNVMLIVLNTAPSCDIFRHGDNVSDFVSANRGHVFVCEWANIDYKTQDKLREFIETHWGKKIT